VLVTVSVAAHALAEKSNRQATITPAISADTQPNRKLPGLAACTTLTLLPGLLSF
jgi:hypothetical protein